MLATDVRDVVAGERGLGAHRAKALAEHHQLRPVVLGQFRPSLRHGVEQLGPGLLSDVGVDERRDPAGQERVLDGDHRGVAGVQLLDGGGRVGVDPAGAGDGGDDEDRAVEPAGPLEVVDRQRRPALGVVGRVQPGVDAHGAQHLGVVAVEREQVVRRRGAGHEVAALAARACPRR